MSSSDPAAVQSGTLINGRFRPVKRLGSGSFGEIYMGVGTNGEKVAIKFEKAGLRCPQLRHEYKVYRELANCPGIGRVHHYGTYGSANVMVMDLLGPSLEDLFTRCGRRFSLKTTLKLADQLLDRVDTIHNRHLIHRDIKPANFVMGSDITVGDTVYCIDFGLSKRYRNPHTLQHIPHRVGKSLTGTPRYASVNNHLGIEQSRRDDLEAIGYVLIYFLKGRLPWQGLKARNASRKYKMIMEKKQATSISSLCAGCPTQFAEYLQYCRALKFEAPPNVKQLRQLFRDLYLQQGFPLATFSDADWDWNPIHTIPKPIADGESAASSNPNGGFYDAASGSRPQSASAARPNTAATNAAHMSLSIGGHDTRDSADGEKPPPSNGTNPSARPQSAAVDSSRPKVSSRSSGDDWADKYRSGNVARRPQSAHGARTSPSSGQQAQQRASYNSASGSRTDGYVVAGAKSMMTYRRSRGSNYPSAGEERGWRASSRPKSAGVIGSRSSTQQQRPASTSRPSSSSGARSSGSRPTYYMTQNRFRSSVV